MVRRNDGLLGFEITALTREVRRHLAPIEAPLAAANVTADFLARRAARYSKDRMMAFSADVAAALALRIPQALRLSPRPDETPRELPSPGRDRGCVVLEICAGAGGMALGLQKAGFKHAALYDFEARNCTALVKNGFPEEIVICEDVSGMKGRALFRGKVDLLAGSPPCQPFSAAGRRWGEDDERDLFPDVLRLMEEIGPRAVLLENVGGFMERRHQDYRLRILRSMEELGYRVALRRVHARMVGIPQSRERIVILALRPEVAARFRWPFMPEVRTEYLEDFLKPYVLATRHPRARDWVRDPRFLAVRPGFRAKDGLDVDAPTILAGEGRDCCRTGGDGTRAIWRDLGFYPDAFFKEAEVRGHGFHAMRREVLASSKEEPDLLPITVEMMAALQGFPDGWRFAEKKGEARQQVGNAFPPALAQRIGIAIRAALEGKTARDVGVALEARPPRWVTGRRLGPPFQLPGMVPNPEYVRFERARTGAGMLEEDEVESLLGDRVR